MQRHSYSVGLIGLLLSGACLAEEVTLCKSTCAAERRVCSAKALERAKFGMEPASPIEHYRPSMARNTAKLQSPSAADQAMQHSSMQKRRVRDDSACAESYARCTRACTDTVAASADSMVIVKKRQAD